MRWLRTNRRFVGTLALLALALQFTLSFGHIHLRDFAGVPGVAAAQAQPTTPDPTRDPGTGHSTDDYCLICATANLAGTLVLPSQIAPYCKLLQLILLTSISARYFVAALITRYFARAHLRSPNQSFEPTASP